MNEHLTVSGEKNLDGDYGREDVLSVSRDFGVVNQIEFQGRSYAGASVLNYSVLHHGGIVYTKSPLSSNPFGIIKSNKGSSGIVSTLYAVYSARDNAEPDFVDCYFQQDDRLNRYLHPLVNKGAKNDMKVSAENALLGLVCFPERQEQKMIAAFFASLDNLITLHQRECWKASFIRPSAWEQRKLGEIAHRVTRKNEGESDLPLTISAQFGLIDQRSFFNSQVASNNMSGYFLLRKGEFAYNKSTSSDSPWGAVKRLEKYKKGCVSTLYICFDLEGANPDYLVSYYETDRWHKGIQMVAAEGARNHGLLNIAPDDFFETKLSLPKTMDEQRVIGTYFSSLDSLITLHQRQQQESSSVL